MTVRLLGVNLEGRVKKVQTNDVLVPLFEAISNSIHAVEDREISDGKITLEIIRNPRQESLLANDLRPITGFTIIDNGIGFDSINMESFSTSDSILKAKKGGKGVGRFTWLKFFEKVTIHSLYNDNNISKRRSFTFSNSGIDESDAVEMHSGTKLETRIELNPIFINYEEKSRKDIEDVAVALIEHFISYFVTNSMPEIILKDGAATQNLRIIYKETIGKDSKKESFEISNHKFTATSFRSYLGKSSHAIYLCGNSRVADKVLLGKRDHFFIKRFVENHYILLISKLFFFLTSKIGFDLLISSRQSTSLSGKN